MEINWCNGFVLALSTGMNFTNKELNLRNHLTFFIEVSTCLSIRRTKSKFANVVLQTFTKVSRTEQMRCYCSYVQQGFSTREAQEEKARIFLH